MALAEKKRKIKGSTKSAGPSATPFRLASAELTDPREAAVFNADCLPLQNGFPAPRAANSPLEQLKLQFLFCYYEINLTFKLLGEARANGVPEKQQLPLIRQIERWMQHRDGLNLQAHPKGLYADPIRQHGRTVDIRFGDAGSAHRARSRLRAVVFVTPPVPTPEKFGQHG